MHHLIFPSKDAYITNQSPYDDKNFGLDEILRVGSYSQFSYLRVYTHTYTYPTFTYFDCLLVDNFTGQITGSFSGSSLVTSGSILGSGVFTSSYFSGSVTGSISGSYLGNPVVYSASFTGSLSAFSGSISSSVSGLDGWVTGSLYASRFVTFTGTLSGSAGKITGYLSGSNTANEQEYVVIENKVISRAFVQFDVTAISQSIVDGTITAPEFRLKLKVAKEEELPLAYTLYAYPVSQSWEIGTGYVSDGGSDSGISWNWRNFYSGSPWYLPATESKYLPTDDYLNTASAAVMSFGRGGGTWYYTNSFAGTVKCSQSFNYETSDVYMDVTTIVSSWISGSLPNNGFIVMSSVENQSGSNGVLTFFSRDTNTVFSPTLDVMWNDSSWVTGSVSTGSVTIATSSAGISASIFSGSSFAIAGGIAGIFSASTFLQTAIHHITASEISASGIIPQLTASYIGSVTTTTASVSGYLSGNAGYVSGSAIFTSSYWSGSIDNVISETTSSGVSGSQVIGLVSGSFTSASVSYFSGSITASSVTGPGFIVSGHYLDTHSAFIGGIVSGQGLSGNIFGLPVYGYVVGTMQITQEIVTGPCGNSFTASFVTASFTNGIFSGSTFGAYYIDSKLENAYLTGSWIQAAMLGTKVSIPLPSGIEPYAYAYVTGVYVNGKALGTYTITGSLSGSTGTNTASFYGQFIEGNLVGGILDVQLTGSVFTASYISTSSVEYLSSSLIPLNTGFPYKAIIQNLLPSYTAGNIPQIRIFGREELPLKNFTRKTQMTQYLNPKYLPTSSHYSIKDNETEEIIIDFDNYTRLSCDANGNYFQLDTTAFAQERNYRIRLKVIDSSSVHVFDDGRVFKIVR